jgi:hypothetical protein
MGGGHGRGLCPTTTPHPPRTNPTRMDTPQTPTEVYFNIIIIDIVSINEREETFTIEGSMYLEWFDPRLAFDPAEIGADFIVFHNNDAANRLGKEMWSPVIEFENSRGTRAISNISLMIEPDGSVAYEDRFNLTLYTKLDLHAFPFDTQELDIRLISFYYNAEQMLFHPDSRLTFPPNFRMNEWEIAELPTTDISTRAAYGQEVDVEGGWYALPYAQIIINLQRDAGFYIWKLMVPLLVITSISWAGFWRKPSIAPRAAVTFSCMLTVVAYNFAIGNSLPRISYLTYMDLLFILTYTYIALAVFENVIAGYYDDIGRGALGIRIDQISRWLFPTTYLLLYFLLFTFGGVLVA